MLCRGGDTIQDEPIEPTEEWEIGVRLDQFHGKRQLNRGLE